MIKKQSSGKVEQKIIYPTRPFKAFKKGLEDKNIDHYNSILLYLCPPEVRENVNTKMIVSQVNMVLILENIQRDLAKMEADLARRTALYDAASQTQNPICMAMALLI